MISALGLYLGGTERYPPSFLLNKITMRKIILTLLFVIVLVFSCAKDLRAQTIAEQSAVLNTLNDNESFDYRVENLRKFLLKYNSPLAEYAEEFVTYADDNNLDYRLIPAIAGVESTFGKHIPNDSYNAYGWSNGEYTFTSWENSISHVSSVLKTKYFDRGVDSISEIARVYAPPSKTWGKNVSFFVNKIDTLPLDFDI